MNNIFKKDYERLAGEPYRLSLRSIINMLVRHNFQYVYWLRKYQSNSPIKKIYRIILYMYTKKYGLEISPNAKIGEGLYLGHPYNITVNGDCKIGRNVNLHKGVTIGRENRGVREGCPTIGNNVYVGINAIIVGKIHIGNDVMICPNAFVNFDVPDHSIVMGNPGIIHRKDNATDKYVINRV